MVTLREIAGQVGVSVSVVSRVLNRNPDPNARVSKNTRALVERAAKRMGYRPNRTAEFLKRGQAPTIGVFLPKEADHLIADLVCGLSEEAYANHFPLGFGFGMSADCYRTFVSDAEEASNCGVITYPYGYDSTLPDNTEVVKAMDRFRKGGGKVVLLCPVTGSESLPSVSRDDYEGGRLAAERLLARSCRTFMCVSMSAPPLPERTAGFVETVRAAGGKPDVFGNDADGIAALATKARASKRGGLPIGVFATNDRHAVHVLHALRETRFRVGRDALVIGHDDAPLSKELTPALTTIHQPFAEMGRLAMRKVINLIYGEEETSVKVKPYLVARDSA